jgi:hypothetical protein
LNEVVLAPFGDNAMKVVLTRSLAAFAGVFVVLAMVSSSTTFHLGPAVVSAAGPVAAGRGRGPWPGLLGLGVALVAVGLLEANDHLLGPTLLPVGGALLESVLAAITGALLSFVLLRIADLVERPQADQA